MLIEKLRSPELQAIYQKYNLERVYLFGSYLTGEQRKDSDVDLLVTFTWENGENTDDKLIKKIFSTSYDARKEIEWKVHHTIDFVPNIFLKKRIREQIDISTLLSLK